MADIKAVSFRLGEDAIERFKQLALENECNQAELFDSLIGDFELAKAKNQIVGRAKEIETFQSTSNTLVNMFINSLAINQTAEATIKESLREEIDSKDTTIVDLQKQKSCLIESNLVTKKENEFLEKQNKEIVIELQAAKTDLTQKTNTINSQLEQISTLNSILSEYKTYKDKNIQIEAQNKDLLLKNSALQHKNVDLEGKIKNFEQMIEFYNNEIANLKADKTEGIKQLQELKIEFKSEKENLENKFNIDTKKMGIEYESKLEFEKQKIELEKQKIELKNETLITKNKDLKEQYNNIKLELDKKAKTKTVKTKQEHS